MSFIFKILFTLSLIMSFSFSNSLVNKNLYDQYISINKGSYKILEFDKMIKAIKASDKESIEVDFVDDKEKPLQSIKLFSKKLGHSNMLITFYDATSLHIDINVIENLTNIIAVAKEISPNLIIKQTNGKIILKGHTSNQKEKDKILDLFKKAGVDLDKDLVDLIELENPDKMVRVKLYAVEINNDKGLDLKNNWFVSSKNYMEVNSQDGYYNMPLDAQGALYKVDSYKEVVDGSGNTVIVPDTWKTVSGSEVSEANNQRNTLVHSAIDNIMAQAVSLTGGLTGAANYLGKHFNAGVTLNYLSSKGVAKVLDETTLLTLENKEAKFLAGGTLNVKTQTTTAEGLPSTRLEKINYGLQLEIIARNIVNDNFVSLDILTKTSAADFSRTVDGIPNIVEKSITTNVVVGNQSTIILGGLINRENAKDIEKIPLLGDIPVLGFLFTSQSFKEGKSELVFFITPEIVDPKKNNQENIFAAKTDFKRKIDKKFEKQNKDIDKLEPTMFGFITEIID